MITPMITLPRATSAIASAALNATMIHLMTRMDAMRSLLAPPPLSIPSVNGRAG